MAVFCKSLCCQYKSNLWWLIPREPRFELWLCRRNSLFHVFLVHFTQLQAPPLPTIAIAGFIQNPSKTVNISSCCLMYSKVLSQAAQRRSSICREAALVGAAEGINHEIASLSEEPDCHFRYVCWEHCWVRRQPQFLCYLSDRHRVSTTVAPLDHVFGDTSLCLFSESITP